MLLFIPSLFLDKRCDAVDAQLNVTRHMCDAMENSSFVVVNNFYLT